jgi:hypothetical protein
MTTIKLNDLKKTAKELNTLLGIEPPIDVKIAEAELTAKVKEALELLEPGEEKELTETAQNVIKALKTDVDLEETAPDTEEAEEVAKPVETKKAEKAPAEKKLKGEKKDAARTAFGSAEGSQAALIDNAIISKQGKKVKLLDIAESTELNKGRIKSHILHLVKKGFSIEIEKGASANDLTILYKKA